MITDQDVEKLKGTFATNEALGRVEKKVDSLEGRFDILEGRFDRLEGRFDTLEGKVDSLDVKFDAMLGLLTDSMQEHAVGAVQYARHDRQIKTLATATGVTLPE